MEFTFLGTGGYHPNDRRETSAVFLPEVGVMFDAGTGVYRLAERLRSSELEIFLSHAHLDHIIGLTYLLVPLMQGKLTKVRVHGTAEHLQAVREHLFAPAIFPVLPEYEFLPLSGDVSVAGGGVVKHVRLDHPGGSVGYRIDFAGGDISGGDIRGGSLAYITDTTAGSGDYVEFIRGVDVLIHECNFPDRYAEWAVKTGHSNVTAVIETARSAGIGRLILTHFDPQTPGDDPVELATAKINSIEVELAEDLRIYQF